MDTATINHPPGSKAADTAAADRRLRIYICSPYRPRMEAPELAKRELADNIDRAKTPAAWWQTWSGPDLQPSLLHTVFG